MCPGRTHFRLLFSHRLFLLFVKPAHRFDNSCSPFGFRDQRIDAHPGHALLVGGDGVTLNFAEAFVAGDGRDNVGAASGFRQTPTGGFAQPVG
jgi:hypothetical protein